MKSTVSNYQLKASNGRPIRIATQVIREDGISIQFTEKLSKSEALRQFALQVRNV